MGRKRKEKIYTEITYTEYKIMYRKKTDPDTWLVKCICKTQTQAEKFIDVLEQCANVYIELKIEPVTVHAMKQL